MKKVLLLIANLLFVYQANAIKSVWDGRSSETSWYDESSAEFHLISAAQFKGFADLVSFNKSSFEGKTVYLDCDVDLNGQLWSPIGLHYFKQFAGNFDGQNHEITNLWIDSDRLEYQDSKDYIGLFGYADQAEIKNLKVSGVIDVGYVGSYIGGVASFVKRLENIYSDMTLNIKASKDVCYIGNVAGHAAEAVRIYSRGSVNCRSDGNLYRQCSMGGVVANGTAVSECRSSVDMNVKRLAGANDIYIGGVAGQASDVSNALFTGSLVIEDIYYSNNQYIPFTGGICGRLTSGNCLVSVPSYASFGLGFDTGKSLIVPTIVEADVTSAYYLSTFASPSETRGVPLSEDELKSGNPLTGLNTDIWEFAVNEYPSLVSVEALVPQPTYTVEYYVDGSLYHKDEYHDGEAVTPPADPEREGYSFSGWDYIPPFISGSNLIIQGYFTINNYTITYLVDDQFYASQTVEYDSYITPPDVPFKQGYLFTWESYPYRMPAYDITIIGYYRYDTYECVDLGLPSGLLWASKNVGAAHPEDYGMYFAWGEISPKESYYWGSYKYCNGSGTSLTKYCTDYKYGDVDNLEVLTEEDDAATANWGKPWRLPTLEESQELISYCTWSVDNDGYYGIKGFYVTGPNGNSIYLPAAGVMQYQTGFYKTSDACILTSSVFNASNGDPSSASVLYCEEGNPHWWYGWDRCWGYSVRPVTNVDPSGIRNTELDAEKQIKAIYDVAGHKISKLLKGINIVHYTDGTSKKVVLAE